MKYRMIHSCIRVMDLKKSEDFYQNAFGFEIARRLDFPEHKFTLSYLKAPGGDFELELTHNHDQEQPYQLGNGYSHLALGADDLEASHCRHQEQGYNPKPLKGLAGGPPKFYFLADPDGYLIEVVRNG
jgi:lactoylglutathione lyase